MSSRKLAAMAVLAVLVVAACGGSSASPTIAPNATAAGGGGGSATPLPTNAGGQPTAAGGGTTPAPGGGGTGDLCRLFTGAELKLVTGTDFLDGVPVTSACTWVSRTDATVAIEVEANSPVPLADVKLAYAGGTDMTFSGHAGYWVPMQGIYSLWIDASSQVLVFTFAPVPAGGQADIQKLGDIAISHF